MNNSCDWDKVWAHTQDNREFLWWLERERNGVRGRKISSYISKHLGKTKNAKAIEIGAGTGVYSLIFAKRGAEVTLLDYSQEALALARKYFETFGLSAAFIYQDALKFDSGLRDRFDLAMSFGTVEHYREPERFLMARAHLDLVRPGGIVIISVPNRYFFPHETLKFCLQKAGKWGLGYEHAISRGELFRLGKRLHLENIAVCGSSFITDMFRYVGIVRGSRLFRRLQGASPGNISTVDIASHFDDLLGADIFLMGTKPL